MVIMFLHCLGGFEENTENKPMLSLESHLEHDSALFHNVRRIQVHNGCDGPTEYQNAIMMAEEKDLRQYCMSIPHKQWLQL
jgi:hypothetical protein